MSTQLPGMSKCFSTCIQARLYSSASASNISFPNFLKVKGSPIKSRSQHSMSFKLKDISCTKITSLILFSQK